MKSFSDKLTTGPEGSGSVTGSLLMTCCCMMLSRTRVISAHAQNSIYVLFQTMGGGVVPCHLLDLYAYEMQQPLG